MSRHTFLLEYCVMHCTLNVAVLTEGHSLFVFQYNLLMRPQALTVRRLRPLGSATKSSVWVE